MLNGLMASFRRTPSGFLILHYGRLEKDLILWSKEKSAFTLQKHSVINKLAHLFGKILEMEHFS